MFFFIINHNYFTPDMAWIAVESATIYPRKCEQIPVLGAKSDRGGLLGDWKKVQFLGGTPV